MAFRCRSCSNCLPGGAMSGCQTLASLRRASWTSRLPKGGSSSSRRTACSTSKTGGGTALPGYALLVDEASAQAPGCERQHRPGEHQQGEEVPEGDGLESEARALDERDAGGERVELRCHQRPVRQLAEREERAGGQEHRR